MIKKINLIMILLENILNYLKERKKYKKEYKNENKN